MTTEHPQIPDNALMLIAEASRVLGLAPATLRVWADNGRVPTIRVSGGVRIFWRDDIERVKRERESA